MGLPRGHSAEGIAHALKALKSRLRSAARAEFQHLTSVSDEALVHLPPSIKVLDLFGCEFVTSWGVQLAVSACLQLEELVLRGCHRVDDAAIQAIARSCRGLQGLSLSGCEAITDRGVFALRTCVSLRKLGLHQCSKLTNAAMASLAELTALQCLDVGRMGLLVDDLGLQQLLCKCHGLVWLNVRVNARVTDDTLHLVATHCPALERLICGGCPLLTSAGITAVCAACPGLRWVHVRDVEAVDDNALLAIGRLCKSLQSVDIRGCPLVTKAGVEGFYLARGARHKTATSAGSPEVHLRLLDEDSAVMDKSVEFLADDVIAAYVSMMESLRARTRRKPRRPPLAP